MSVSEAQATAIVKKAYPKAQIQSDISYSGKYVFQVFNTGQTDGEYDCFFSVDQQTGALADFSILTDGNTNDIIDLFLAKQKESA